MMWGLAFAAVLLLAIGKANANSLGTKGGQQVIDTKGYSTSSWIPYLSPLCQANSIPLSFMTFSIEEESNGNPCAIGAPGALGPDGNPRELGIFQLYNPDDLQLLKVTGDQMRAFCVPGKIQVKNRAGVLIDTHRQDVARLLTDDEMKQQASLAIGKVKQARNEAGRYILAASAKWSQIDTWRVVKLVHGLPGLVKAIVTFTNQIGHAPSSWSEYRNAIESKQITLDANTEKYRGDFAAIFDNAEKATEGMEANA